MLDKMTLMKYFKIHHIFGLRVIHKLREQDFRGFLHPPPPLWTGMNFLNTPSKSYVNIQEPPPFSTFMCIKLFQRSLEESVLLILF